MNLSMRKVMQLIIDLNILDYLPKTYKICHIKQTKCKSMSLLVDPKLLNDYLKFTGLHAIRVSIIFSKSFMKLLMRKVMQSIIDLNT